MSGLLIILGILVIAVAFSAVARSKETNERSQPLQPAAVEAKNMGSAIALYAVLFVVIVGIACSAVGKTAQLTATRDSTTIGQQIVRDENGNYLGQRDINVVWCKEPLAGDAATELVSGAILGAVDKALDLTPVPRPTPCWRDNQ